MATYIYETIPQGENEEPEIFEFKQSMRDAPFRFHPDTGKPMRRVISGGYGLVSKGASPDSRPSSGGGGCGCGAGGCGVH